MDPQARIMLETTYEAICDAGVCPQKLRGTKTGVYVGINTVGKCLIIFSFSFVPQMSLLCII
jgi:acyl transferase domain-containing protein